MPTVLQDSSTKGSAGQVLSVQSEAPPYERSTSMKRQMAGSSPHSDEARLVGNQPLSFDIDLQNGGASTSGDSQLRKSCLDTLHIFVSTVSFQDGNLTFISETGVQHYTLHPLNAAILDSPFTFDEIIPRCFRQRSPASEQVVGRHLSHCHRGGGRGSALFAIRFLIPDVDWGSDSFGNHYGHQPVHRLPASSPT